MFEDGRKCAACRNEIPENTPHLQHKSTGSRLCKKCESKMTLHSPQDFKKVH